MSFTRAVGVSRSFLGTVSTAVKVLDIGCGYAIRCGSNPGGDTNSRVKNGLIAHYVM